MGFLERQFRAQFTPSDGGYLLTKDGVAYRFDADAVEQFVAEWKRHWSLAAFAAYLLIGVALPAFLYFEDYWGAAFVIGTIAGIVMVVNLIYPLRQPAEATLTMFGDATPSPERPPSGADVLFGFGGAALLALMPWFFASSERTWYNSSIIVMLFWSGACAWVAAVDLMLWLRAKRGRPVPLSAEAKSQLRNRGMYLIAPLLGIAVWLTPGSDWLDRAFPLVMLALPISFDVQIWWRKRREGAEAIV